MNMWNLSWQRAIQMIAEQRIRDAMERGDFDDLPGFGQPLNWSELDVDTESWLRAKIQREKVLRQAQGNDLPPMRSPLVRREF